MIGSSFVIVTKDKIGEWWSFLNNEVHLTSNNSNLQRENEKVPVWVIVGKCGNYIARREGNEVKREYWQEIFKLQLTLQRCTFALQCNKTVN